MKILSTPLAIFLCTVALHTQAAQEEPRGAKRKYACVDQKEDVRLKDFFIRGDRDWKKQRVAIPTLLAAGIDVQAYAPWVCADAAWYGEQDILHDLADSGADFNSCTGNKPTLLYARSEDVARTLIRCGASVNTFLRDGGTLLHGAVQEQYGFPLMNVLCEHGIDVNACDNKGHTALYRLLMVGSRRPNIQESVLRLLRYGAVIDVSMINDTVLQPRRSTTQEDRINFAAWLRKAEKSVCADRRSAQECVASLKRGGYSLHLADIVQQYISGVPIRFLYKTAENN